MSDNKGILIIKDLLFSSNGENREYILEHLPHINFPLLQEHFPELGLYFDLQFTKDKFIKAIRLSDIYYIFSTLEWGEKRKYFGNIQDISYHIKNLVYMNLHYILEETLYDVNHMPINVAKEEDCPYCKAIYPKVCQKHSALTSWETSSRNAGRYFPAIMNLNIKIDDNIFDMTDKYSKVILQPTRRILLSVLRTDGVLSLLRNGKWFSYI